MPIECSRRALSFNLFLIPQLVSCGFWDYVAWTPSQNLDPGESPQPVRLPPNTAFFANQSIQPSPTYSSGCQVSVCTIQASVSSGSVPFFSRNSKTKLSQPLYSIGLQSPRTRLVLPQFLAHPRLPFPMG